MTGVRLTVFEAGATQATEHAVLQNRVFRRLRFPAMFALIEHPTRGPGLFDAGYSQHFLQATQPFPERLYRDILPVTFRPEDEPKAQLRRLGMSAADVTWVFLSHFHADHIGALHDFPAAQFIYRKEAWDTMQRLGRYRALTRGFLPALIPKDFAARSRFINKEALRLLADPLGPFGIGFDLFDDGTVVAIPLPGHVEGHMGLLVKTEHAGQVFLIGDAAWTSRSFQEIRLPHPLIRRLFADGGQYQSSIERLHALSRARPDVRIIPSHCETAIGAYIREHNHVPGRIAPHPGA